VSGFLIAEAAAAAFRVNSTAVRRFTPDGDTDVSCDTVLGCVCSEDAVNLTGVVAGTSPPDESEIKTKLIQEISYLENMNFLNRNVLIISAL
jgi:hypothetical protein